MRSLATVVLSGSLFLAPGAIAQSLSEHAAAAAGATIGTAAGKPLSNALTSVFGAVDKDAQKAASTKPTAKEPKLPEGADPKNGIIASPDMPLSTFKAYESHRRTSGAAAHSQASQETAPAPNAHRQPVYAIVAAAPPEPLHRDPTPEELASIKVGASEKEMVSTLGPPESKVTIPDDDHLLEICQYWVNGKPLATFRLDNGKVVKVDSM